MQLAASASIGGVGIGLGGNVNVNSGYGNTSNGGSMAAAVAQAQAAMLGNMTNINRALVGLSPQQAQALLAAAAATAVGGSQQQQQYFGGLGDDGFNSGIDSNGWTVQSQASDEYALSLMQLQQLAIQNNTAGGGGGSGIGGGNNNNISNNNLANTAEDVMPLNLPGAPLHLNQNQQQQQQQQQQSASDVSALSMLLMQQHQQLQQQQDQFIRAHHHQQQQQQQRRPSNLGPSAAPAVTSDTHHYVENTNSNAPSIAAAGSLPSSTQLNQQQGNWPVNFHHHSLLQKVQSADLRRVLPNPNSTDTNDIGTNLGSRPGSGTYTVPDSTIMNSTIHHSRAGSIGGGGIDSPTIRASWGSTAIPQNMQQQQQHNARFGIGMSSVSAPTSQAGSFGAGSPLTDGLAPAPAQQSMQQQQQLLLLQRQQEFQSQQHSGLDALKSIWSKP
jgi:hypothetical protein